MNEPSEDAKQAAANEISCWLAWDASKPTHNHIAGKYVQQAIAAATAKLREELEMNKGIEDELREANRSYYEMSANNARMREALEKVLYYDGYDGCHLWHEARKIALAALAPKQE